MTKKKSCSFFVSADIYRVMQEPETNELLARYVRENSEEAFTAVVALHINLVYATALRQVGNPHQAEEITQAVFLILAKKAGSLSRSVILSGWLYRTTRLTAANYLRSENRRQRREQEAHMQSLIHDSEPGAWAQLTPQLDATMALLDEKDQNALVLRFFEKKSFSEVGRVWGTSEDAAKMRVGRAVERLRKLFARRDIALSAVATAGALSACSAQAAPAGLTASIALSAMATGIPVSASTLTLMKSTLNLMTWLKIKSAVLAGAAILLTATTAAVAVDQIQASSAARSNEPSSSGSSETSGSTKGTSVKAVLNATTTAPAADGIQASDAAPSNDPSSSGSTQDDFAKAMDTLVVPFLDLHQVTLGGALYEVRMGCDRANPGRAGVQFFLLSYSPTTFDLRLENVPLKSALSLMAAKSGLQYRVSPLYDYHMGNDGSFIPQLSKIICTYWPAHSTEQFVSRTFFISDNAERLMQLTPGDATHAFEPLGLHFPQGAKATLVNQELTTITTGDQILQIIALLQAADPTTWHSAPTK